MNCAIIGAGQLGSRHLQGLLSYKKESLNIFNKLFRPLFSYYTKNSIDAVINEFSSMIKDETNLTIELENLKKFSATYKDSVNKIEKSYKSLEDKNHE
jgi:hypothetical protein